MNARPLFACAQRTARQQVLRHTRVLFSRRTIFAASSVQRKLPDFPARTRFAPSPTGNLHLGSLRTALYNYLLARATGGQFLLRIEDTDQSRTIPGAQERICQDLEWAGLQWDEGPKKGGAYGPYVQSERTLLYQEHANKLLTSGHAYRCFCSAERLQELAQMRSKLGLATDYDRSCAGIPQEESDDRALKKERHTIRLKSPDAYPAYEDIIYGSVGRSKYDTRKIFRGEQIFDDPILLKSDGSPTYHLANVVDDHHMKITHVIRGIEWIPSTPKHIHLYNSFGWTPPEFAHVGLLQGVNNQKLSKRSGDIDIGRYRDGGIFPEALVNFVALLGWHHKQKVDVMDLEQMARLFDLSFTKGNTVVNFPKLDYVSREYAKKYAQQDGHEFKKMLRTCMDTIRARGVTAAPRNQPLEEYVGSILKADPTSYLDQANFFERHKAFFTWSSYETPAKKDPPVDVELVATVYHRLEKLPEERWSSDVIDDQLHKAIADRYVDAESAADVKPLFSGLLSELRRIIFASRKGPGMAISLQILGRMETLERLSEAGFDR